MKVYSDYPARRTTQILADVIAVALIGAFVWAGVIVYGAISVLAAYGKTIEDAGLGFEQTMADAGDTLGGVPLIGGGIRAPFDAASGAGTLLAQAGQAQQDLVMTAAITIGVVMFILVQRRHVEKPNTENVEPASSEVPAKDRFADPLP